MNREKLKTIIFRKGGGRERIEKWDRDREAKSI